MTMPIGPTPPPQSHLGQKLGDPRADSIPCPMLRTLVNEDLVHVGPDGNVSSKELAKTFKKLGLGPLVRSALVTGGKASQASGILAALAADHINFFDLRQGTLMHTGDTRILRDGFNQARLDSLLSYSSDGKGLTVKDLAKAQGKLIQEDPGTRGHVLGTVELSALILVFGQPDDKGEKALSKEALVSLFRDNKIPSGWTPHHVGSVGLMAEVARFAYSQRSTASGHARFGLMKAVQQPLPLDASAMAGLRKGMCPYLTGSQASPPVSAAEVAVIHQKASVGTPNG